MRYDISEERYYKLRLTDFTPVFGAIWYASRNFDHKQLKRIRNKSSKRFTAIMLYNFSLAGLVSVIPPAINSLESFFR